MTTSTRTPGITAFLTALGIDFITRGEAGSSHRDSIPAANIGDCIVAGRKAKVRVDGDTVVFVSTRKTLVLKPYTAQSGSIYYWSAFDVQAATPSMSASDWASSHPTPKPARKRTRKAA